jgi:tetratricopeptide (TPR) repeat protein
MFNPLEHQICLSAPKRLTYLSTWIGHIPFAMTIVDILKPKLLVELGSFTGESFCAFCQGVKELGLETKCYAVDTWQGDPHADFYTPFVLMDLKAHTDLHYPGFATLLPKTFDEALNDFEDKSIDLLHIDGLHTYEAVKHDFETWLPKVSDKAVILFHDIAIKNTDFGVWKFWDEIKTDYPHFEFDHSCGLGVLVVGKEQNPEIIDLCNSSESEAAQIKDFFHKLEDNCSKRPVRHAEALRKKLIEIFKLPEEGPQANILVGKILQEFTHFEDARREFFKAATVDNNNSEAYAGMGKCLAEMKFTAEAEKHFRKAAALNPEKNQELADFYLQTENFSRAARILRELPKTPENLIMLVGVYVQNGDLENARKFCLEASEAAPNNPKITELVTFLENQK